MTTSTLTVKRGSVYKLRWTVLDGPVINSFVNPDGTQHDFVHPDPRPNNVIPSYVAITVRKGATEATATPDSFRKNRTPPRLEGKTTKTLNGKTVPAKIFSATFRAREEGVYLFNITYLPDMTEMTQKMVVAPVFRTIQEVILGPDSVEVRRRQAVLSRIADFFPAFNTHPTYGAKKTLNTDSGILNQGKWVDSYAYDGSGATSCTTVNPIHVMARVGNRTTRWGFDAGPEHERGPSPAWVTADKDHIPQVGDTYIVRNLLNSGYGHVGVVVHVPPENNGMWVTVDGGQGPRPEQLAILVPRWGIMGEHLPKRGGPAGRHPRLRPEPDAGPFLSGATPSDIDTDADRPQQNGDVPGIIERINFYKSSSVDGTTISCPRRMAGFVDLASNKLSFDVDAQPANAAHLANCELLKTKVDKVIAAFGGGAIIGGKGS